MAIFDPMLPALLASAAALVSSLASLVWAFRRKA